VIEASLFNSFIGGETCIRATNKVECVETIIGIAKRPIEKGGSCYFKSDLYGDAMNTTLAFMNLGGPEFIWIFIIVILLFGAKKIPELARGLGRSMGEFKKARSEFERELSDSEKPAAQPEKHGTIAVDPDKKA
jgi:TatA/E family protein of Tat protein translocase